MIFPWHFCCKLHIRTYFICLKLKSSTYCKTEMPIDNTSAVVFRLFTRQVNLPQKTVGYWLTLIQSSNLYFSLIRVILLELNHCCAYMQCLCCNGTKLFFHFFGNIYSIVIQWVTDDHKLKGFFMLSGHTCISIMFLLHYMYIKAHTVMKLKTVLTEGGRLTFSLQLWSLSWSMLYCSA